MINALATTLTLAAESSGPARGLIEGLSTAGPWWWSLIVILPLIACVLNFGAFFKNVKSKLPAWISVGFLGVAFLITLVGFWGWKTDPAPTIATLYEWIGFDWGAGSLVADIGFYMDGLSWLWMIFVTGLGTLIALYASEYMSHDLGRDYARFFAAFCLFVFSMACLVMGDNLLLLYLGWEGVGLCSYLLIGYFFKKPEAVEAAKKAFIVNRIGDLGLALGLFLTYTTFGSIEYAEIFRMIDQGIDGSGQALAGQWVTWGIPCLLMIGAFGKSAQLPLYVWLPDAMEGPTPVSALIHAATMVTAGVYMIARLFPIFTLDADLIALNIVAWVGALTALLAATIGMAQFDIKRIMAYSTVSQLGYMFAGLGVLSSTGAVYHVFTHAFFKAMLFLACGAVMHGFAGQLSLRKLSGLWSQPGWKITTIAMFIGCINLAGFPLTAGYFSKDVILAESFTRPGMQAIGWILLFTAGLTAYYTFRVFFRVFVGPAHHEPGDDLHDHDEDAPHDRGELSHHDVGEHGDEHDPHFHPHPPQWAINFVLTKLAVLTLLASSTYFIPSLITGKGGHGEFVKDFVTLSSADEKPVHGVYYRTHGEGEDHGSSHAAPLVVPAADDDAQNSARFAEFATDKQHASLFGFDPRKIMYYVSAVVGLIGIALAAFLHGPKGIGSLFLGSRTTAGRARADDIAAKLGPIPRWAENKWYVDEFYHAVIVMPLKLLAHIFHMIDKLLVDGLVNLLGFIPRLVAMALRPSQNGVLHTYATGMAVGIAVIAFVVWLAMLAGGNA